MPQEIRRLVFSYAEVTDAIINYGKKYDIRFPVGQVTNVKFAKESDIALQSAKEVKSSLNRTYNVQQKRQSVILSLFDSKTLEQKNFASVFSTGGWKNTTWTDFDSIYRKVLLKLIQ